MRIRTAHSPQAPSNTSQLIDDLCDVTACNPSCPSAPVSPALSTLSVSGLTLLVPALVMAISLVAYAYLWWDNRTPPDRYAKMRESGPSVFDLPKAPVEIECKDVVYVSEGKRWCGARKSNSVLLLKYVSGMASCPSATQGKGRAGQGRAGQGRAGAGQGRAVQFGAWGTKLSRCVDRTPPAPRNPLPPGATCFVAWFGVQVRFLIRPFGRPSP